jgi:hypothetical protein
MISNGINRPITCVDIWGFAGISQFQPGELICALGDPVGDAVQDLDALLGNQLCVTIRMRIEKSPTRR